MCTLHLSVSARTYTDAKRRSNNRFGVRNLPDFVGVAQQPSSGADQSYTPFGQPLDPDHARAVVHGVFANTQPPLNRQQKPVFLRRDGRAMAKRITP